MESSFILAATVLICALTAITVLKLMNLPTVPAYFIAGMAVGPGGFGVLQSGATADFAAELGIILLLFTVGLQFNVAALKALRNFALVLGGMQVFGTAIVVGGVSLYFTDDWLLASLVGFVAMLSPTAVVSQILLRENSVNSPVGRRAVGVLLFQDFMTIPLIILYSSDSIRASLWTAVPLVALKIAVVLAVVFIAAPPVVRRWLDWTAVSGDKEMFVFSVVALIIVSSLATGSLNLTYVLGPFLVGILIAETAHRENVERIVEPFRYLLMGIFFMTVGMLIDVHFFIENFGRISAMAVAMWVIKMPILYFACRAVKTHEATAWRMALLMGGGGPFGFVILSVAKDSGVLSPELFQLLVPANILALAITPFVWAKADKIVRAVCPDNLSISERKNAESAARADKMQNHMIICGFGRTGQSIAGIFREVGVDFIGIDNNHMVVEAAGNVEPVIYGDSHETDVLTAAGIRRAAILNISFAEPLLSIAVAEAARKLNPDIYIIAKATSPQQAQDIERAGADQTLVEAHQCGLSIAGQTLRRLPDTGGKSLADVFKHARYRDNPLFRGQYLGTEYTNINGKYFISCVVRQGGETASQAAGGASIVLWLRDGEEQSPKEDGVLQTGDELVLMGAPKELHAAKKRLL